MLTPDGMEPFVPVGGLELDDAASVNAWLRAAELGRRLTVAVLEPPGGGNEACGRLCERLSLFPEVRVLPRTPPALAGHEVVLALLSELAREDADALIVWATRDALGAHDGAQSPQRLWIGEVLACADDLNLRDRCFTVLAGEGMTRQNARKVGYEDGFAADVSPAALVRALGREALDREVHRRRGSSPPCYL